MLWAVVPAKLGPDAKRRLAPLLAPLDRSRLAEAMLRDVLTALADARSLSGVAVVGRGRRLLELATSAGALAIEERAARSLDEAVAEGVAACVERGAHGVVIAMGDLPLLRPDEIDHLASALPERGVAVAPSFDGTGTNLLAARPPGVMATAFGPASLGKHRALARDAGLPLVECPLAGAALDVDTPLDLARLAASDRGRGEAVALVAALAATSSAPSASHSR